MSRARVIDYYLAKSLDTHFEIDQIRKELEKNNVDDEEIKIIVRLVDNEIQKRALLKSNSQKGSELIYTGFILTVVGAGITFGTYTGVINMGDSFLIVYGPFFAGVSLLVAGFTHKKSTIRSERRS